MAAFPWDDKFVTGLTEVDRQHHHLVDLINGFGDLLASNNAQDKQKLDGMFQELAAYAVEHFSTEEQLMRTAPCDERHYKRHKGEHDDFVKQVMQMRQSLGDLGSATDTLLRFLTSWLAFHILGSDQVMARQVLAIQEGMDAAQAYDRYEHSADPSTAALLGALHGLYHLVAEENAALTELNASLERRVEERTQALEATRGQLLQSEKLASIGQLAAGVAHEINNPIGFVSSNLGTLTNYVGTLLDLISTYEEAVDPATAEKLKPARKAADIDFLREDVTTLLQESKDGLDRVKRIVQDLRDFSHVDEAEWQLADLNKGMESTLNMVWNELKYKATVVREYGQLPLVRCLAGQMNQVFMNLLTNAVQAIKDKGTITVRSGVEGDQVWVEVEDTGCGIPPGNLGRLFDPFFTTKPIGKGTDLGLSLTYGIVTRHGGRIEVDSQPGRGSRFRVWLPVKNAENASA
ncbi:MAG: bacteriohemerythrin [Actinomycetota bacterium]